MLMALVLLDFVPPGKLMACKGNAFSSRKEVLISTAWSRCFLLNFEVCYQLRDRANENVALVMQGLDDHAIGRAWI